MLPERLRVAYDTWLEAWANVGLTSQLLATELRAHARELADENPEAAKLVAGEAVWRYICSGDRRAIEWVERNASAERMPDILAKAREIADWFDVIRGPCPGVGVARATLPPDDPSDTN
jgi:hypothetical protein